ncbi:MAG: ATP-binding protein [Bacillota bacterium]
MTLENPGYIRVGKKQMLRGGLSDPRNKALMKMFNMINVGERAGSGVPNILQTWSNEEWIEPVIDEQFNPDRTILKLSFIKKDSLGGEILTQRPTQATQGSAQGAKEIPTVYNLPDLHKSILLSA